ncbi:hypothetical protein ACIBCN_39745 [Nocardia sp. NPDC051052]|uniref:hypothetical protein n=1 Tax=Nocardia sp. NPDC051052 TaxID=3364322 RepID=UPI00378B3053
MNDPDEITAIKLEIRVLQDVINAVDTRLRALERSGVKLRAPRPLVYATVIYEVIASAAKTSCGTLRLVRAPILDSILDGVEIPDGVNLFDRLLEITITN